MTRLENLLETIGVFTQCEQARLKHERIWYRVRNHYYNVHNRKYEGYSTQVFVPYTFTLVENLTARAVNTIFSVYPVVSVSGIFGGKDDAVALQISRYLNFLVTTPVFGFFKAMESAIKEAILYGTGFIAVSSVQTPFEGAIVEFPSFVWLPLNEIYVDPHAYKLEDVRFLFRRYIVDRDALQSMSNAYGWNLNVDELPFGGYSYDYWEAVGNVLGEVDKWEAPSEDNIELLEVWERERMYWIVARYKVVGEKRLKYGMHGLPYVQVKYTSLPSSFWGLGLGRVIYDLQEGINLNRIQRLHNAELINNKVFVILEGAVSTYGNNIAMMPGKVIKEKRPNAVRPLEVSDIRQSAYLEEQIYKTDIQMASGEMDYLLGFPPQRSRERATTVIQLQKMALNRFEAFMRRLSMESMNKLFQKVLLYTKDNVPKQVYERIIGEKDRGFYNLTTDEILTQYDYSIVAGIQSEAKDYKLQRLTQILPAILQSPYVRQDELIKRLLTYFGVDDAEKLAKSQEEVMEEQQRLLAMQEEARGGNK